jgi:hypothetical protein
MPTQADLISDAIRSSPHRKTAGALLSGWGSPRCPLLYSNGPPGQVVGGRQNTVPRSRYRWRFLWASFVWIADSLGARPRRACSRLHQKLPIV